MHIICENGNKLLTNKNIMVHLVYNLGWKMQPNIFEQDFAREAANSSRNIITDQQEQQSL